MQLWVLHSCPGPYASHWLVRACQSLLMRADRGYSFGKEDGDAAEVSFFKRWYWYVMHKRGKYFLEKGLLGGTMGGHEQYFKAWRQVEFMACMCHLVSMHCKLCVMTWGDILFLPRHKGISRCDSCRVRVGWFTAC